MPYRNYEIIGRRVIKFIGQMLIHCRKVGVVHDSNLHCGTVYSDTPGVVGAIVKNLVIIINKFCGRQELLGIISSF